MSNIEMKGKYVDSLQKLFIASAVSGTNCVAIGLPGYGKTRAARAAAEAMGVGWVFIPIESSTPPEDLRGRVDRPHLITTGEYRIDVTGSAYDPNAKVVLLDEFMRANDPVFDAGLHASNRTDLPESERPVFWATANFAPKGERQMAIVDRFALWLWLNSEGFDAGEVGTNNLLADGRPSLPNPMPQWSAVDVIRHATPGPNAIKAIKTMIDTIAGEVAAQAGSIFSVNPRRASQWAAIIFRYGMYLSGSDDFATVPNGVLDVMRFAYPTKSFEEYVKWGELVISCGDPVDAVVQNAIANAYKEFNSIAKGGIRANSAKLQDLGRVFAGANETLAGIKDPRAQEAIISISGIYAALCRGENPENLNMG